MAKDVAKVIMGGRSDFEGSEAAQELQLLLGKPGDVRERLGARKNCHQNQQDYLRQGVLPLPGCR